MMAFFLTLCFQTAGNDAYPSELAHTYSIVAYDPQTREIGAAVQSHWFSVGSLVIWAQAGVGAVATQSFVRVDYGPLGLEGMAAGEEPRALLGRLTGADPGKDVRQVAMVDARGRVAGHTGEKCIDYACDRQGTFFSVQANLMLKDTVCAAMERAFTQATGPLAERLVAALAAAEGEGGDLRGRQSAAIKVVSADKPEHPWEGVRVDLRVEDHDRPVEELTRLVKVSQAYDRMNQGDLALEHQKVEEAMGHYRAAVGMLPGRVEPLFWQAVNLVGIGKLDDALPLFKQVFAKSANWRVLPPRLAKVGLLPGDPKVLDAIAAQ